MADGLKFDADAVRRLGHEAVELIAGYYEALEQLPIMPLKTAAELRKDIREPLPRSGTEPAELLAFIRDVLIPATRHNAHPRFFGYVASPGTAVSAVADLIAGVLNTNVTAWRSAPGAVELEHLTVDWLKQIVGYPATAGGLFVSGGSMANFAGLAAARSAISARVVHASSEAHFSIAKAARMLGLDLRTFRSLAELDADTLHEPCVIVASAGTVSTGAVDRIGQAAAIAARHGAWLHVDGSYGGVACMAPSVARKFAGMEAADSISLDPHKWLYTSMGCGCILYRDPVRARAAFAQDAEYTKPIGFEQDEAFAFWDYGPELSRRFRALSVWMQIKSAGVDAIAAAIEENIACARYFESLVHAADDFEMLAPVELSIFCFRYRPAGYTGDLDRLNERVMVELQRTGSSYVSNARVGGHFALRGCVLNYRTTRQDMEVLLDDVRRAGRSTIEGA